MLCFCLSDLFFSVQYCCIGPFKNVYGSHFALSFYVWFISLCTERTRACPAARSHHHFSWLHTVTHCIKSFVGQIVCWIDVCRTLLIVAASHRMENMREGVRERERDREREKEEDNNDQENKKELEIRGKRQNNCQKTRLWPIDHCQLLCSENLAVLFLLSIFLSA